MTTDAIYLDIFFNEPDKRPLVLQYFMERPYGIMHLLKASINTELSHPIPMRAAWIVSHIGQDHPSFLQNYYGELLETFLLSKEHAVMRSLGKALNHLKITPHRLGELYHFCFDKAADTQLAVAARVNCIYILKQCTNIEPELLPEVKLLAQLLKDNVSEASLQAALRKTLH